MPSRRRSNAAHSSELRPEGPSAAGEGALFEQSPLPSWVFDPDTLHFLAVNDAAVRQYGWTREEFLGMTVEEIRPPETLPMLRQALADAATHLRQANVTVHRTREGRVLMVEVISQAIIHQGRRARLVVVNDLTQWMDMQRAARASEESYRALVDSLTDVFFRTDTAGRWTLLTPSWHGLTGDWPEESLGRSFLEWLDPRDHEKALTVIPMLVSGQLPETTLELRYRTATKGWRWVEARARRTVSPEGSVTGMAGTLHDVTDRIEARERVRSSDARFHAIYDRAAIGIVVATLDGRILEANPAYRELVGYSEEELRELPPAALTPTDEHALEREMIGRAIHDRSRVVFEKRYLCRGGRIRWAQVTLSCLLDAAERPERIIGMVEDVTARKVAERALEAERKFLATMLDNLSDGIIACDATGAITISNRVARTLGAAASGTVDQPHLGGVRVFSADGTVEIAPQSLPLARALRGEAVQSEEFVVVPAGEPARTILASAREFRDEAGAKLGAVVALHDITDRKAAEVALRSARDEADAARDRAEAARARADDASRAKSDFLARMSHELRTPLNSIIGFANVLQRSRGGTLPPADLTYLSRISANGKHLLRIIDELLDLTRIEARRMPLTLEPVDADALIRDVAAAMEPQLRDRPVALHLELPRSSHAVSADGARLRQVLVNLVGNAVKFTERGEIRVRLVVNAVGEPLRLEVEDTGIGIAPERLQAVFEAFEQAEPTTTRHYGGTGLGLAISRSLCELMGFTLHARSTPGVGTTMIVELRPPRE